VLYRRISNELFSFSSPDSSFRPLHSPDAERADEITFAIAPRRSYLPSPTAASLSLVGSLSMPPSLPVELLQQIVEESVPSTYHSKTYTARCRTIARFSSVCRLFYRTIQPLVYEVVVFDFRWNVAPRMAAALQGKAVVKEAIFLWGGQCLREDFQVVRSKLSECHSITIQDCDSFDLSLLAKLPSTSSYFFSVSPAV